MTSFIIKTLLFIIIIVTTGVIYTLLKERRQLQHEGLENKGIKDTSSVVLLQPLKKLCILASSDSIMIDNKASPSNVETLIRRGVRWLDFNVTDNDGVPFISDNTRLDIILQKCRTTKNLSPNPNMPLFINIRVSTSGSEPFYNNIQKFIKDTFNADELYNSPGKVKTLLSDTKDNIMNIISEFTRDTDKTVSKLNVEPFENTNLVLGTENELYENLTYLGSAYRNNRPTTEGMKGNDDDIYNNIINQQNKIDNINKLQSDLKKKIMGTRNLNARTELTQKYTSTNKDLINEKAKLVEMNNNRNRNEAADFKKISQNADAINSKAVDDNRALEIIKNQATEPVIGAIPSVQREIDKLRNDESLLRLQNVTLQSDIGKLRKANTSYSESITSIKGKMNDMYTGVEKGLTKKVQCKRCVSGDTLLGELKNKVVIALTRSQFINDAYNNSNLSKPGNLVNIEIKDYNNDADNNDANNNDDRFYNVIYQRTSSDVQLPANFMKITNVPNTTKNIKNMILNNIQSNKIQVLQVPDLENKPEYISMFNHFESAFIPMVDAIKYINR